MIAVSKRENLMYKDVILKDGYIRSSSGRHTIDSVDLYYSQLELQQRIEVAVAVSEQNHMDVLQGWHDECEKLKARIAELEAERQPVEVSAELAKVIEHYKEKKGAVWEYEIITDLYAKNAMARKEAYGSDFSRIIGSVGLIKIIKRGYTVKPDPVRSRIEQILKEHEGDESFESTISAIMELFAEEEYLSADETWELYHESRAHIPHITMKEIIENLKEQNGDPDVIDQISTKQAD